QIGAFTTDHIVALETRDIAAMTMPQLSAITNADVQVMSSAQLNAYFAVTPIVLDLTGGGIHTLSAAQGVNFDLLGTGQTAKVGWVAPTNGLLVMDINHDGVINNGSELFGTGTILANGKHAANGYEAMASLDTNHDGKLTTADAHFKDLRIWVDANHDGKTDPGELKLLSDYNIVELDLNAT
ncbi:heme utilization protein, partial [Roseateles sp. GG27B]